MSKTYFISGHTKMDVRTFSITYIPLIRKAIDEGAYFVIGDAPGVDEMAQVYLRQQLPQDQHDRVKVFFKGDTPQNFLSTKFMAVGDFVSHEEAAVAMSLCSDEDIACLDKEKWGSLTAKNILRRYTPYYNFEKWATARNRNVKFWDAIWYDNIPADNNTENNTKNN